MTLPPYMRGPVPSAPRPLQVHRVPVIGETWQTAGSPCEILAVDELSGCVWVRFQNSTTPKMYTRQRWERWTPPAEPIPPNLPPFLIYRWRRERAPFIYTPQQVMQKRRTWTTQAEVRIGIHDRWFIFFSDKPMVETTLGRVIDLCEDETEDED